MTQHKHAAVFEAAIRGEADEWEVKSIGWSDNDWKKAGGFLDVLYTKPDNWIPRRKQKTHVVNGFTVPEPLRETPIRGSLYFVEDLTSKDFQSSLSSGVADKHWIDRGLIHATKEGAIANCKARLGIDPYKDES